MLNVHLAAVHVVDEGAKVRELGAVQDDDWLLAGGRRVQDALEVGRGGEQHQFVHPQNVTWNGLE